MMNSETTILVTGCAGFIGYKTCEFLLSRPELVPENRKKTIKVIGIDNLNDYYDVRLKEWRLKQLSEYKNFIFKNIDIENYQALKTLFLLYRRNRQGRPFDAVINLAARAGVRYSLVNPYIYYTTNVIGNLNLLELCREFGVKKYVFASTSSLYAGQKMPFKETLPVNEPISPYAASKKSAEVTCYTYHKLYGLDITIVRYFTVYGIAGRPDMSVFRFIKWIDEAKSLILYGDGKQSRDFTYIDDIVSGTIKALKPLGYEIINLGNNRPHTVMELIRLIEKYLGKEAKIVKKPFHQADMHATWADIKKAKRLLGWQPETDFPDGLRLTVDWYLKNRFWLNRIRIDLSK
ncbi:MAG: GDP-mannose 4,6-dehydratase [bacterium]